MALLPNNMTEKVGSYATVYWFMYCLTPK